MMFIAMVRIWSISRSAAAAMDCACWLSVFSTSLRTRFPWISEKAVASAAKASRIRTA